jgi:hypothetical protein
MRRLPHQGARHSTVDHGDASDGVLLLLHLCVLPSSRAILLAVAEKGAETTPAVGQASWLGPTGLVRSPLHSHGSSCIYALCPLHLHHFDDVILTSKMEVLLA